MATEVVMPRLSDSMEEGTIVRWLVADGQTVKAGDALVEIETDKATMTYEAEAGGVVRLIAQEGDTVALGAVIARIGVSGEPSGSPEAGEALLRAPLANGSSAAVAAASRPAAPSSTPASLDDRPSSAVKASPVARRVARELGVDLATVRPSGPHGRIVKADVRSAATRVSDTAVVPPSPTSSDDGHRPAVRDRPPAPPTDQGTAVQTARATQAPTQLTRLQQVVARRMAESKASIPDFALFADVDMGECLALRSRLGSLPGATPSLNDMIIKACALALRDHPRANASYRDGAFELHDRVNVGLAVAADDALVVPTVTEADRKSLGAIAADTRRLIAAVRDQSIAPADLAGGTFTVSNLGMYGVASFAAIVNPPQAAILTVGALERRPAVTDDDRVVVASKLTLGLVCDHRILYGADAAQFLAHVRDLLQQPLSMAL